MFGLIPALKLVRVETNPALQSRGCGQTGGKSRCALSRRADDGADRAVDGVARARGVVRAELVQRLARRRRIPRRFAGGLLDRAGAQRLYAPARSAELFERLEEDLAQIPGVTAVAHAAVALLDNSNWNSGVEVEGYRSDARREHGRRP